MLALLLLLPLVACASKARPPLGEAPASSATALSEHSSTDPIVVLDRYDGPAFAELLGRLPLETDVFVLLSMRDDFLFQCQAFEALAPVFSEMTPLGSPTVW